MFTNFISLCKCLYIWKNIFHCVFVCVPFYACACDRPSGVCVCAYIYVYLLVICASLCEYLWLHIWILPLCFCACIGICVCMYAFVCVCVRSLCLCLRTCLCFCVCICMCAFVCVCMLSSWELLAFVSRQRTYLDFIGVVTVNLFFDFLFFFWSVYVSLFYLVILSQLNLFVSNCFSINMNVFLFASRERIHEKTGGLYLQNLQNTTKYLSCKFTFCSCIE